MCICIHVYIYTCINMCTCIRLYTLFVGCAGPYFNAFDCSDQRQLRVEPLLDPSLKHGCLHAQHIHLHAACQQAYVELGFSYPKQANG